MAGRYRSSADYLAFLDFAVKFRTYAPFNALLVHIQKPGANFIAPASRWLRDYDRELKPAAQPLVILQPGGPVMFVFDVSDTHGAPLPKKVEDPFVVRGLKIGRELDRTISNAQRDGVRVSYLRQGSQRAGCIATVSKSGDSIRLRDGSVVSVQYDVLLEERATRETQYATLVHELAHLYCGHLGSPNPAFWPDRQRQDHDVKEFEAESVCSIVCRRRGVDSMSETYLSGFANSHAKVPMISIERVTTVAGLIEQMGRGTLPLRKKVASK